MTPLPELCMATTGVGYKTACDVLCEVSLHLIEQIVLTTATSFTSGNPAIIAVASQTAMYVGAQLVVGWKSPTVEVVTVTAVNGDGTISTTALVNFHVAGETVLAPTFPSQQPTDPFFTQGQMLDWLATAQDEFLSICPVAYKLTTQTLVYGQVYQDTPSNCIEINRVAATQYYGAIVSITRTSGVATVVTTNPHGLVQGSTIFTQSGTTGFSGTFFVSSTPTLTSLTYAQQGADGTANGGELLYFSRIYETTQAEITMEGRQWRNNYVNMPTAWFEDRSGLYRWGVNGKSSSNYPVELLCSIRDSDTFGLLSGFLIPDMLVYALKYKVLAYALGSDNEQADPTRAEYCERRFQQIAMATNRFLEGTGIGLGAGRA